MGKWLNKFPLLNKNNNIIQIMHVIVINFGHLKNAYKLRPCTVLVLLFMRIGWNENFSIVRIIIFSSSATLDVQGVNKIQ